MTSARGGVVSTLRKHAKGIGMTDDPLGEYPPMMSATQVAEFLNTSVERLAQWRFQGIGPPSTKITPGTRGLVRYPREDLRRYLAARTNSPAVS